MPSLRKLRVVDSEGHGLDKLVIQLDPEIDFNAEAFVLVDTTGTPLGTSTNPLQMAGGGGGGVSSTVDVTDRATRLVGHVVVDGTALVDLVDGAGRLLGHVSVDNWPASQAVSGSVSVSNLPATQPVSGSFLTDAQLRATPVPVTLARLTADQGIPAATAWPVKDGTADLFSITATGTAGASVTATLPAAGAGVFHYIEFLEITAYSTAARTGSATPIVVTSTNLPGNSAWTFATAAAIGSTDRYLVQPTHPIRCSAANTATTIVCPATSSVIWRVNIHYWTSV